MRESQLFTGSVAPDTVEMEREHVGHIDYVSFIFDKYRGPRFQVHFGVREKSTPHSRIRAGFLVWKLEESVMYKWWGAKWWNLNKNAALLAAIRQVKSKLPDVLQFLDTGQLSRMILKL